MEPVKLATFLLQNSSEWNAANMEQAMHSGKERYVTLNQKMPVFIAYLQHSPIETGCLISEKTSITSMTTCRP